MQAIGAATPTNLTDGTTVYCTTPLSQDGAYGSVASADQVTLVTAEVGTSLQRVRSSLLYVAQTRHSGTRTSENRWTSELLSVRQQLLLTLIEGELSSCLSRRS